MVTSRRQGCRAHLTRLSALWLTGSEPRDCCLPGKGHGVPMGGTKQTVYWGWCQVSAQDRIWQGYLWQWYVLDCGWTDLWDPLGPATDLLGSFRQGPSCPSVSLSPGRHCQGGLLEALPDSEGRQYQVCTSTELWPWLCALKVPVCLQLVGGVSPHRAALAIAFPTFEQGLASSEKPSDCQHLTLLSLLPSTARPLSQEGCAWRTVLTWILWRWKEVTWQWA